MRVSVDISSAIVGMKSHTMTYASETPPSMMRGTTIRMMASCLRWEWKSLAARIVIVLVAMAFVLAFLGKTNSRFYELLLSQEIKNDIIIFALNVT